MPYQFPNVRVETADGVATVWLAFPGSPVNALGPARLAELDRALAGVLHDPHLDAVVIRSALPAGFCGGYDPAAVAGLESDEDAAAFAVAGQAVLNRLAAASAVTVAFVEGPCLGPGLELALACDYRLAVTGPDAMLGFPYSAVGLPPCWGGLTRLGRKRHRFSGGYLYTAREARRFGVVDDAFCQRRAKVELRLWLDRIQANPRKPRRAGDAAVSLAAERAAFRAAVRVGVRGAPQSERPTFPAVVGLVGADGAALAVEAAIRGSRVILLGPSIEPLTPGFAEALRRGRITPLEADQARGRVTVTNDPAALHAAGFVIAADARRIGRYLKPAVVVVDPNGRRNVQTLAPAPIEAAA